MVAGLVYFAVILLSMVQVKYDFLLCERAVKLIIIDNQLISNSLSD